MKPLVDLYNAIMNDASIRRYTLTHSEVVNGISKKLKGNVPLNKFIQFENKLVKSALDILLPNGKLYKAIETFSREMNINIETLHSK